MQFMLMLYADEKVGQAMPHEDMEKAMEQMFAYQAALQKAGAFIDTKPLAPTDMARTLRLENGRAHVQDGPYIDTKEQFGGYFIIDAHDMDAACKWAAQCPAASWGTIEIRPLVDLDRYTR